MIDELTLDIAPVPLPGAYRLHLPSDGLTILYTVTESPDGQVSSCSAPAALTGEPHPLATTEAW